MPLHIHLLYKVCVVNTQAVCDILHSRRMEMRKKKKQIVELNNHAS